MGSHSKGRWVGARVAAPPLLAFLLLAGPSLGQRPIQDQDILQYLVQTITWYRNVSAWAQARAESGQAVFANADGLRQSSTEALRLAFEFARLQSAIPAANAPDNAPS